MEGDTFIHEHIHEHYRVSDPVVTTYTGVTTQIRITGESTVENLSVVSTSPHIVSLSLSLSPSLEFVMCVTGTTDSKLSQKIIMMKRR